TAAGYPDLPVAPGAGRPDRARRDRGACDPQRVETRMRTIRSRLLAIGAMLALAVWQLIPTNVTQRVRDATTGRMKDTTIRRVPINLGLELQGGSHLAREVDQSTGPGPDFAAATQPADRVAATTR